MEKITIQMYGEDGNFIEMPIEKALNIITDEWVDDGNCYDQITIDLRDACKKLLKERNCIRNIIKMNLKTILITIFMICTCLFQAAIIMQIQDIRNEVDKLNIAFSKYAPTYGLDAYCRMPDSAEINRIKKEADYE